MDKALKMKTATKGMSLSVQKGKGGLIERNVYYLRS